MENRANKQLVHALENADQHLQEIETTIKITAAGAATLANGEYLEDVLLCIGRSLQTLRAELDEAAGIALQKAIA